MPDVIHIACLSEPWSRTVNSGGAGLAPLLSTRDSCIVEHNTALVFERLAQAVS